MHLVTDLQRQILEKRSRGLSYRQIAQAVSCSLSTVSYFLAEGSREKSVARGRKRRQRHAAQLKNEYGAQCAVCGYDRCMEALEFDHINPEHKVRRVSEISRNLEAARKEAEKCLLLCCRCHRERHAGLLDIGAYMEPTI